jgi:nitronate monooxygenase
MHMDITRLLGCEHPIIQAPMAGGGDTPQLVAACGNAGAFGFIGAAYLSPQQIEQAAQAVRALSKRPFGINLFAPTAIADGADSETARARLAPYYAEFGLAVPAHSVPEDRFAAQLDASLACGASAISFTFGMPSAAALASIKSRGLALVGTATTVAEALALRAAGFDAIVAQGSEAGGHRGTFLGAFEDAMIGTMALVPQIIDAAKVPVIASGGIMDGRGIAAALALGAGAVQMGTAFLTCAEAGIVEEYKNLILTVAEDGTRITRAFSGRPARGIVNRFLSEMATAPIAPFPIQNALTRPLRTAAAQRGRTEFLSLWCGQSPRLARRQGAAELVQRLVEETRTAIDTLNKRAGAP